MAADGETDQPARAGRESRIGHLQPDRDDPARGITLIVRRLVERFDPTALDLPAREARIRLVVSDEGEWDVLLRRHEVEVRPAENLRTPDATLSADRATWASIADDVRGGMDAFRSGRLIVRHNLHLGVGFLAATSGASGPGRLRFEHVETLRGRVSLLTAGQGEPVLLLHGLGATKGSFLPTVAALAPDSFRTIALDLPGFGDSYKPIIGLLSPAVLCARGRRRTERARHRARAPHRQQPWRSRRTRGRAAPSGARRADRPARAVAGLARAATVGAAHPHPAPGARRGAGDAALGRRRRSCTASSPWRRATGCAPAWTSSCAPTSRRAGAWRSTPRRARSISRSRTARRASGRASRELQPPALFVWGTPRHAGADRLRGARQAGTADGPTPRARLRPRAAARAPAETHAAIAAFLRGGIGG